MTFTVRRARTADVWTIRDLVEPKSWDADKSHYVRGVTGAVVVRHTARAHRAIDKLLMQLHVTGTFPAFRGALPGATGGSTGISAPTPAAQPTPAEATEADNGLGGVEFGRGTGFGPEAELPAESVE